MDIPIDQQRPPLRLPSSADWSSLRPLITELYLEQRWTMDQVRHHLMAMGCSSPSGPDPSLWPSPEPRFQVRGQEVTIKEIELYFRRKRIQNPLQWAHSTNSAGENDEKQVVLLNDEESFVSERTGCPETSVLTSRPLPFTRKRPGPPKHILTLDEKAVANMQEYCSDYIGRRDVTHQEPQVHQFTIHGQFGEKMRDGLEHMIRNGPDAFPNFNRGFELLHSLFLDCHPMALAQLLLVKFYIQEMLCDCLYYGNAHTEGSTYHARLFHEQEEFYGAFARNVICTLMRVAANYLHEGDVDSATTQYHMALSRAEHLTGLSRAKTRFIALRVANKQLNSSCTRTMGRAISVVDPHVSKEETCTLLKKGLAEAEQLRSENARQSLASDAKDLSVMHLQNASIYIDEALCDAQEWFEESNRRFIRASERRAEIGNALANMTQDTSHDLVL
ncbi:hypothetical protein GQ44DRAFT_789791 [Phaeosphaeriaceae sp. PMI808]|nr:hypothetical protein GQ44DRAFT_789791 [Phaeosphaeriaceae sp. PMI808]